MGVYDSEDCHKSGRVDTIDHAFVECLTITVFWNYVGLFIDKIAGQPLRLTPEIKLLGQLPKQGHSWSQRQLNLINWTLIISRYAIHNSAVYHRVHQVVLPVQSVFAVSVNLISAFSLSCIGRDTLSSIIRKTGVLGRLLQRSTIVS